MRIPGGIENFAYISSDYRKKFNMELDYNGAYRNDHSLRSYGFSLWMRYQPFKSFSFSLSPGYNINRNALQYVTDISTNNNTEYITKYILGYIDQATASLTARLNYSITPNLSIQYYGQPFVSKGLYKQFKLVTDPGASGYEHRFHQFSAAEISFNVTDQIYQVDENRDGSPDYSFDNPDYDFLQFNSNLVVRWEYKPGSTIFLVWTQARTGSQLLDSQAFGHLTNNLFQVYPTNVFLLKFSYRFFR